MEVVLTKKNFEILSGGKLIKQIPRKKTPQNNTDIYAVDFNQRIFCTRHRENNIISYTFYQIDDVKWKINKLTRLSANCNLIFYPKYGYFVFKTKHDMYINYIQDSKITEKFHYPLYFYLQFNYDNKRSYKRNKITHINHNYICINGNLHNLNTKRLLNNGIRESDEIVGLSEDNFIVTERDANTASDTSDDDEKLPIYDILKIENDDQVKYLRKHISDAIKILPDATVVKTENGKYSYYQITETILLQFNYKKEPIYLHTRECINLHVNNLLKRFPKVLIDIILNFL